MSPGNLEIIRADLLDTLYYSLWGYLWGFPRWMYIHTTPISCLAGPTVFDMVSANLPTEASQSTLQECGKINRKFNEQVTF